MSSQANVSFREVQHGIGYWLSIVLLVAFMGPYVWTRHAPPTGMVVATLLLIWFFNYAIKMVTEVRDDGVYVQWWPLMRMFRRYPFTDIESAKARTYNPIGEYGGWGIRVRIGPGAKLGGAYNMQGNRGVQLVFKNGTRLLIGSQQADNLEQAIRSGMSRSV